MTLTLPAPAKLNLFLHVTGRRDDGYHNLQTLFQLLDYGDELHFKLRQDGKIHLTSNFPDVPEQDNLVYKAAKALAAQQTDIPGVDIHLHKRLPAGGGLGGGSSDAATTLLGLNRLWKLGYSLDSLANLGLTLGADVPVFIQGKTAWAEGVGEQLESVEIPPCWYLVLCPDCQVSTVKVFSQRELTRNAHPITIRAFLEQGGQNHCLPVVEKLYPEVAKARKWLDSFAPAQLTGTGACLFARFDNECSAQAVLQEKPGAWSGFVARGVNTSPLHKTLY